MVTKTEQAWAIAHPRGLYIGTHKTRAQMIAEHVHFMRLSSETPTKINPGLGSALDADQKERWKRYRKNGDRAVKVTLTYDYDPA